jgi:uncharacterized protein (DUF488 family)
MATEQKDRLTIYTVGHSTRSTAELVDLLKEFGIEILIDIRRIPYSRYNPQFNRETMMEEIPKAGLIYEHLTELGGIKPPQEVIDRAKSCSERSRGFAGYMQTPAFRKGLEQALARARDGRVALMCAEADPRHCHRFWVADAIEERGVIVQHIVRSGELLRHPQNLFSFGE